MPGPKHNPKKIKAKGPGNGRNSMKMLFPNEGGQKPAIAHTCQFLYP
jgi:hypothetical protein